MRFLFFYYPKFESSRIPQYLYICTEVKCSDRKILLSWVLLVSLILPMGIGVVHAFHQHESELCQAKNESHYHSEKNDCDQLHYFSQTISDGFLVFSETSFIYFNLQDELCLQFSFVNSYSKADSDRGPPFINVY